MKCSKCGQDIPLGSNRSVNVDWDSEDYYEYVIGHINRNGRCFFVCHGDYSFLTNREEGRKRLEEEGYVLRPTGCDEEWVKKDD